MLRLSLKFLAMIEKPINLLQDVQEHRFGEPSRLRVLLAGMVGREEIRKALGEFGHGGVRERVCRPECNPAASLQNVEITVPGNLSKSQYGAWLEQLEFALKVRTAVHNFFRQLLVVRRAAEDFTGAPRPSGIVRAPRPGCRAPFYSGRRRRAWHPRVSLRFSRVRLPP